jgi:hypothetical protein
MNELGCLPETPTFRKSVGEVPPSPKRSLAPLVDNLPRFVDEDPKSGMLASSGMDTIAFDSPANLLS